MAQLIHLGEILLDSKRGVALVAICLLGLDVKPNETRYVVLTGDVSHVKDSGLVMKLRLSAYAFEVDEASGKRLMQTL